MSVFIDRVASQLYKYPDSTLYSLTLGMSERVDFDLILEAIEQDDFIKREAAKIGEHLGYAAVNTALMLDVELLILGGTVLKLGDHFLNPFKTILKKLVPVPPYMIPSALGEYSGIYGAFAVGTGRVLRNIVGVQLAPSETCALRRL